MNIAVTPNNPLTELQNKAKNLITVEETLLLISKKLGCDRATAAEILLLKLPEENDSTGNDVNPIFFGRKIGLATFRYSEYEPSIRRLLVNIIQGNDDAFLSDFDDIPF